jgi:broad specificity phosphatase PhoE
VIEATFVERATRVLSVAAAEGYDTVVLGAWGCGVFRNDPAFVASTFAKLLQTSFRHVFRHVTFGILGSECTRAPFLATFAPGAPPSTADTVSVASVPTTSPTARSINLRTKPATKAERRALQDAQRAAKAANPRNEAARAARRKEASPPALAPSPLPSALAEAANDTTAGGAMADSATADSATAIDGSPLRAMPSGRHVLLVRHGEGTHNVKWRPGGASWRARCKEIDPRLTPRGTEQALALVGHPLLSSVDLLVVSPLSRAVQTASLAFGKQLGMVEGCAASNSTESSEHAVGTTRAAPGACRVVLTALHSERWSAPCDEGRSKSELVTDYPFLKAWGGFEDLPDVWWPTKASDAEWTERRLPAFLRWLDEQPEARIAVVGHGAFFAAMLGRHLKNCEVALLTAGATRRTRSRGATHEQQQQQPEHVASMNHACRQRIVARMTLTQELGVDLRVRVVR